MAVRALVVPDDEAGGEAAPALALAIERVRSVITEPALTPVPTAPATVLGLANVRGEIVPVFDTGLLRGVGPVGSARFVIVVETERGPAGLAVAAVPATANVPDDDIVDPDSLVGQ